jgi:hypothetical protein
MEDAMSLGLTALELARIQFAFTVSFHIIFPATSIGLACFLAMLEWKWLRTQNPIYKDLFKYWIKIFAVAFAMGVVSGIVMAYQFGTNWSEFSRIAGSVTGPLLTYEVMSAFFLEAGFLGIMLFGWGRVSPKAHFFATLMVAIGGYFKISEDKNKSDVKQGNLSSTLSPKGFEIPEKSVFEDLIAKGTLKTEIRTTSLGESYYCTSMNTINSELKTIYLPYGGYLEGESHKYPMQLGLFPPTLNRGQLQLDVRLWPYGIQKYSA